MGWHFRLSFVLRNVNSAAGPTDGGSTLPTVPSLPVSSATSVCQCLILSPYTEWLEVRKFFCSGVDKGVSIPRRPPSYLGAPVVLQTNARHPSIHREASRIMTVLISCIYHGSIRSLDIPQRRWPRPRHVQHLLTMKFTVEMTSSHHIPVSSCIYAHAHASHAQATLAGEPRG